MNNKATPSQSQKEVLEAIRDLARAGLATKHMPMDMRRTLRRVVIDAIEKAIKEPSPINIWGLNSGLAILSNFRSGSKNPTPGDRVLDDFRKEMSKLYRKYCQLFHVPPMR